MEISKQYMYAELVKKRKDCKKCSSFGLVNPADVLGGELDSDEIGPWTRWQGNLDSALMIIGQDWGGQKMFCDNNGWDPDEGITNGYLMELVNELGIKINDVSKTNNKGAIYLTNSLLCLRPYYNSKNKPARQCFENCAWFLKEQIRIVSPRVILCLGMESYRAVCRAFHIPLKNKSLTEIVNSYENRIIDSSCIVFPVFHCSPLVVNSKKRTMEAQKKDWSRIKYAISF
jgi:DNA polymerase